MIANLDSRQLTTIVDGQSAFFKLLVDADLRTQIVAETNAFITAKQKYNDLDARANELNAARKKFETESVADAKRLAEARAAIEADRAAIEADRAAIEADRGRLEADKKKHADNVVIFERKRGEHETTIQEAFRIRDALNKVER